MNKSGLVIVTENGLYGLEDDKGQRVVPCEYDKILDYDDDGYIRLLKGEVYSTITIKGKKLKTVGKQALKGINKKAVIRVPKAKKNAYKKLFKGKGQKKSVKVK